MPDIPDTPDRHDAPSASDRPRAEDAGPDAASDAPHDPVLLERCLEELGLPAEPGAARFGDGWWIDATFGAGGHSRAMLRRGARVLAIDQDPNAARYATAFGDRLRFARGNFREMETLVAAEGTTPVNGVLFDLGVSSMQLDEGERGFAFRHDGPLDMRMDARGESAADVVNTYDHAALAALIYRYGEERHSRRVARAIVAARPLTSTRELAEAVAAAYPGGPRRDHPARRTFQALRIHVNDELGALEDGLAAAQRLLRPGGRLVALSYHSLEDRIVKHFLRRATDLEARQKRPETATDAEIERNPRARSAKLRSAVKLEPERARNGEGA